MQHEILKVSLCELLTSTFIDSQDCSEHIVVRLSHTLVSEKGKDVGNRFRDQRLVGLELDRLICTCDVGFLENIHPVAF